MSTHSSGNFSKGGWFQGFLIHFSSKAFSMAFSKHVDGYEQSASFACYCLARGCKQRANDAVW